MARPGEGRGLAALTGGTGFLGRHVARALHADGWRLRLLTRRDPVGVLGPEATPEAVLGDLADADALRRLCRGAEVVVHVAGLVKARDLAAFRAVNVEGAARLSEAAATEAAPGARFVLVSSLAARAPELSDYARSKREGEAVVRARLGGRVAVARPCAVYGPGDRETLPLFRAAAQSPVLPVLHPDARITLIHVEDAARAIAALATAEAGGTTALCDGRPQGYGLREIMAVAAAAVGARPRLAGVPDAAVRAAGRLGDLGWRLGASPSLTSGKARELLHRDWSVAPGERAHDPPSPRYDLEAGFRATVAAHRAAGWM